jgi:predicted PurR-regulated permease PerM
MKTDFNFVAYLIYLPIIVALTWYVAHTLFKNSKVFMLDIFRGKEDIALSTNKLFETGFYLLNIGFALLIMEITYEISSNRNLLEILSTKIGGFAIYLGIMLFFNLYLFFRGRRISKLKTVEIATVENK